MKILSLWQPWATLLARGIKRYETRSWGTNFLGLILVHATRDEPVSVRADVMREAALQPARGLVTPSDRLLAFEKLPRGAIVGLVEMRSVQRVGMGDVARFIAKGGADEIKRGDWTVGRFVWACHGAVELDPIPWPGARGLRDAPERLVCDVLRQLERRDTTLALRDRVRAEIAGLRAGATTTQPTLFADAQARPDDDG